jgi:hypothetical protein
MFLLQNGIQADTNSPLLQFTKVHNDIVMFRNDQGMVHKRGNLEVDVRFELRLTFILLVDGRLWQVALKACETF